MLLVILVIGMNILLGTCICTLMKNSLFQMTIMSLDILLILTPVLSYELKPCGREEGPP